MKMTDIIFVSADEKGREKRDLRVMKGGFFTTVDLSTTKKIELAVEDGTVYSFYAADKDDGR